MTVTWDYTELAGHYDKRAEYSARALDRLLAAFPLQAVARSPTSEPEPESSPFPSRGGAACASPRSNQTPPCEPTAPATPRTCRWFGARAQESARVFLPAPST